MKSLHVLFIPHGSNIQSKLSKTEHSDYFHRYEYFHIYSNTFWSHTNGRVLNEELLNTDFNLFFLIHQAKELTQRISNTYPCLHAIVAISVPIRLATSQSETVNRDLASSASRSRSSMSCIEPPDPDPDPDALADCCATEVLASSAASVLVLGLEGPSGFSVFSLVIASPGFVAVSLDFTFSSFSPAIGKGKCYLA